MKTKNVPFVSWILDLVFLFSAFLLQAEIATNMTGKWYRVSGTWVDTADGSAIGLDGASNGYRMSSQTGTDFTYESEISLLDTGSSYTEGRLVFRSNMALSKGYAVIMGLNGGSNNVRLYRIKNGALSTISAAPAYSTTFIKGIPYRIKVICAGSSIRVFFNGSATGETHALQEIITYTDTPANVSLMGSFGIGGAKGAVFKSATLSAAPKTTGLDTTPPEVSFYGVTDGGLYQSVTPQVVATDDRVGVTVTSKLKITNGLGAIETAYTIGTPISLTGTYILEATATDRAGNTATKSIQFQVNTNPSTVSSSVIQIKVGSASLENGKTYSYAQGVSPVISVSPGSMIVAAYLDAPTYGGGNKVIFVNNMAVATLGENRLQVLALNADGNMEIKTVTLTIGSGSSSNYVPVTINFSGPGKVRSDQKGDYIRSGTTLYFLKNSNIQFYAEPNPGYQVGQVIENGSDIRELSVNSRSFSNNIFSHSKVSGSYIFEFVFGPIPTYQNLSYVSSLNPDNLPVKHVFDPNQPDGTYDGHPSYVVENGVSLINAKGTRYFNDIRYLPNYARANDPIRQTLDVWAYPASTPRPAIVYFYGGSYWAGEKESVYSGVLSTWYPRGYTVISVNYPYVSNRSSYVDIPTALAEKDERDTMPNAEGAYRFIQKNAKNWNIDPSRIIMTGVSAGSGMAMYGGFSNYKSYASRGEFGAAIIDPEGTPYGDTCTVITELINDTKNIEGANGPAVITYTSYTSSNPSNIHNPAAIYNLFKTALAKGLVFTAWSTEAWRNYFASSSYYTSFPTLSWYVPPIDLAGSTPGDLPYSQALLNFVESIWNQMGSGTSNKANVTVINGGGSGLYAVGSSIVISVDRTPSGKTFQGWIVRKGSITGKISHDNAVYDASKISTWFTVDGSGDIEIEANFQ
ncbi:MAG: alpha/beta hydrolase [Verrucomicrobiota bacterium]